MYLHVNSYTNLLNQFVKEISTDAKIDAPILNGYSYSMNKHKGSFISLKNPLTVETSSKNRLQDIFGYRQCQFFLTWLMSFQWICKIDRDGNDVIMVACTWHVTDWFRNVFRNYLVINTDNSIQKIISKLT